MWPLSFFSLSQPSPVVRESSSTCSRRSARSVLQAPTLWAPAWPLMSGTACPLVLSPRGWPRTVDMAAHTAPSQYNASLGLLRIDQSKRSLFLRSSFLLLLFLQLNLDTKGRSHSLKHGRVHCNAVLRCEPEKTWNCVLWIFLPWQQRLLWVLCKCFRTSVDVDKDGCF